MLGPVRAWHGETQVSVGTPQQRALLTVLLLRRGRTATAPELIDAVWGEDPPDTVVSALRNYASRLRKSLGPRTASMLVTESGGYAMRLEDGALDLEIAEHYASRAEEVRESDLEAARRLLNSALGLWHGETLAGVPGPYAQTQRTAIEDWRLSLLESRLKMDLEAGQHAEAVSELTALTATHPLREDLRGLLMLALYRSGRQAEALAVYTDTRKLLVEELGVDPGQRLEELHQHILEADTALLAPTQTGARESVALPRPAQLPLPIADLTGRREVTRELCDRLVAAGGGITAVIGTGGVGKTTLTVHAAHAARAHFPDGQLYTDLRGVNREALKPAAVLSSFLRALGTPESAIPDSTREREALYRSALYGRRVLILLDNASDAAQVRPLLPGSPSCAALINSRNRIVDLEGAQLIDLNVMDPEEALDLFAAIAGETRVAAERGSALKVVEACGFLPLAIRIAACRLASRPTWPVLLLARKLTDKRRLLSELKTRELAVESSFALGYAQLDPQQSRAFRLLGLVEGPGISLRAAAALLNFDPYETEELLESLVDVSLLETATPGRYRFHDLIRLYALSCAEREETPEGRSTAFSRLLDFYLATTAQVYALERPGNSLLHHLEPTRHQGMTFGDGAEALKWLAAEGSSLLACIRSSTQATLLRKAADLLRLLSDLTQDGADSQLFEQTSLSVLSAAGAAGDRRAQGRAATALVFAAIVQGHFEKAGEWARAAEAHGTLASDLSTVATAHNDQGIVALQQGRYEDAERHLDRAITAFRTIKNKPAEASAVCNLSAVHLATGRVDSAILLARRGVTIYHRTGARMRLANAMYALGRALTQSGSHKTGEQMLNNSLKIFQNNRNQFWSAMTRCRLAELHLAAARPDMAAHQAEQALALRSTYGEWWRAKILTVLGLSLVGINHPWRARVCWQEAFTIYDRHDTAEAENVRNLLTSLKAT